MLHSIDNPQKADDATVAGHTSPLIFEAGHLFVMLADGTFLLDTGSPTSFGRVPSLVLNGQRFDLPARGMGILNAETLAGYVGRETDGLLGTNILNHFDVILDVPRAQVYFSAAHLDCLGEPLPLDFSGTVPLLKAEIEGKPTKLFFDTGAQLSYFQGEMAHHPAAGLVQDFYPGLDPFVVEGFLVPIRIGGSHYGLRCGQLPAPLSTALLRTGTEGILGSELLCGRCVGYFPRRHHLNMECLSDVFQSATLKYYFQRQDLLGR